MGLCEIFLELPAEDIAYVKSIVESYEGVGILRTVEKKKALSSFWSPRRFEETARDLLKSLRREVSVTEIPRPVELGKDWLLRELSTGEDP